MYRWKNIYNLALKYIYDFHDIKIFNIYDFYMVKIGEIFWSSFSDENWNLGQYLHKSIMYQTYISGVKTDINIVNK